MQNVRSGWLSRRRADVGRRGGGRAETLVDADDPLAEGAHLVAEGVADVVVESPRGPSCVYAFQAAISNSAAVAAIASSAAGSAPVVGVAWPWMRT